MALLDDLLKPQGNGELLEDVEKKDMVCFYLKRLSC